MRQCWRIVWLGLGFITAAAGVVSAQALAALSPGWNEVAGGEGTLCARGTPFRFFVRPGDAARVAIVFQGGGACWNAATCDPAAAEPVFDDRVDDTDRPGATGIFQFDNPANPIRDFFMLFVPYCTGDVHLGGSVQRYEAGEGRPPVEIRHAGFANGRHAVDWLFSRLSAPTVVATIGLSAGGWGAVAFAADAARRFPAARVISVADGVGGFRTPRLGAAYGRWSVAEALAPRFAEYKGLDSTSLSLERVHALAARAAARVTFAQVNYANDQTQVFFLQLFGVPHPNIADNLAANLADVRRDVPTFRSYVAPGEMHTSLGRASFYSMESDGVRLADWFGALIDGRPVSDVGDRLLK